MVTLTALPPEGTNGVRPAAAGLERGGRVAHRSRAGDVLAVIAFVAGGAYLAGGMWADPAGRIQTDNLQDQGFFEFALAHAARCVTHLSNPFFDHQINVPAGVNMMANTSILGIGIPLMPITVLFGASVSYAVLVALAPALTAIAWYFVLSRRLVSARAAAFVAAAFAGFAPGIVSQSNGHPNIACQFAVPLIFWQIIRLRDATRPARVGLVLGLLIAYQAFINEEVLLFVGLSGLLLAIVYLISRPAEGLRALRYGTLGLVVAVGVAGALLAYPLYWQFFGPQHYGAVPLLSVGIRSDLGSYLNFATDSIGGSRNAEEGLAVSYAEESAFFGTTLLVLALVMTVWLWRDLLVRAAAVTGVVCILMSFGESWVLYGRNTGVTGPFAWLSRVPLVDSVVPARFALVVIWSIAVLLAVGLDRIARGDAGRLIPRPLWYALFAGALVPLLPIPLHAGPSRPVPGFIADGTWRRYVPAGRSLVAVPLTEFDNIDAQRWSAASDLDLPIAGGYFLGPAGAGEPRGLYGAPSRPTELLLADAARTGQVPSVTADERGQARADLRFWRAAVVVIGPGDAEDVLRVTVGNLLGQRPQFIGGAWVWDVRGVVDAGS
jgi:hypothetical protein